MIYWILGSNALTGPIPSDLELLTALTGVVLGKSFLVILLVNLCYKYTLICLDYLLDFR
jgi:hypothetical protein